MSWKDTDTVASLGAGYLISDKRTDFAFTRGDVGIYSSEDLLDMTECEAEVEQDSHALKLASLQGIIGWMTLMRAEFRGTHSYHAWQKAWQKERPVPQEFPVSLSLAKCPFEEADLSLDTFVETMFQRVKMVCVNEWHVLRPFHLSIAVVSGGVTYPQ